MPDKAIAWAVDVVGLFVAANAVEGAIHTDLQRSGRDPQEYYYTQVTDYFAALPPDRFPVTAALAPVLSTGSGEERFAFGLELLVSWLAAQAAVSAGRRRAGP